MVGVCVLRGRLVCILVMVYMGGGPVSVAWGRGEGLIGLNFNTRYRISVWLPMHVLCKRTLPKG